MFFVFFCFFFFFLFFFFLCIIYTWIGLIHNYYSVAVSAQLTVSIDPKNVTASRGDNVNFTCVAGGEELSDQLQFVWLYNGTSLVCTSLNNCTEVFQSNVSDEGEGKVAIYTEQDKMFTSCIHRYMYTLIE